LGGGRRPAAHIVFSTFPFGLTYSKLGEGGGDKGAPVFSAFWIYQGRNFERFESDWDWPTRKHALGKNWGRPFAKLTTRKPNPNPGRIVCPLGGARGQKKTGKKRQRKTGRRGEGFTVDALPEGRALFVIAAHFCLCFIINKKKHDGPEEKNQGKLEGPPRGGTGKKNREGRGCGEKQAPSKKTGPFENRGAPAVWKPKGTYLMRLTSRGLLGCSTSGAGNTKGSFSWGGARLGLGLCKKLIAGRPGRRPVAGTERCFGNYLSGPLPGRGTNWETQKSLEKKKAGKRFEFCTWKGLKKGGIVFEGGLFVEGVEFTGKSSWVV